MKVSEATVARVDRFSERDVLVVTSALLRAREGVSPQQAELNLICRLASVGCAVIAERLAQRAAAETN